jgi:hypothetical protein
LCLNKNNYLYLIRLENEITANSQKGAKLVLASSLVTQSTR